MLISDHELAFLQDLSHTDFRTIQYNCKMILNKLDFNIMATGLCAKSFNSWIHKSKISGLIVQKLREF